MLLRVIWQLACSVRVWLCASVLGEVGRFRASRRFWPRPPAAGPETVKGGTSHVAWRDESPLLLAWRPICHKRLDTNAGESQRKFDDSRRRLRLAVAAVHTRHGLCGGQSRAVVVETGPSVDVGSACLGALRCA
ncbi:uncharacterized protein B0I36DRAFT_352010 [Microdochium trichocladiopsis]|uniref:Secreted protein n=1 Tax=Microdochium trichocladiopsis TaxID=1682393 RepID=A0A9P9BMA9_9PEZI|nr:uncharacterized protein B0I36DRAFT_352010 [Microdochium trichocladiopsis]KAH7026098.1 hypothetical protein B0I36DRAFT_352010 [Microdochium trichocladiopsis]